MIDPLSFSIVIVLAVGFSHALMPDDYRMRLFWIVIPGVLLLFITHPVALFFALASFSVSTLLFVIGRALSSPRLKARIPYAILLMLFVPDLARLANDAPILWLGSAFFVVRQMMTVAQGVKTSIGIKEFIPALLMSTFFFAALPSGPVFNGLKTWNELRMNQPRDYREGCYRLFEGLVYLFAVAGFVGVAMTAFEIVEADTLEIGLATSSVLLMRVMQAIAGFGFLFATFYGYSRIAEGSALLFGFGVPQNFNKPHLARDLGDFWKRWHRSMADFVMQYVYLPLLVTTTRAKLALIAAFVFMGLWHDFSPGFMIWGLGHGIGLAFVLPWLGRRNIGPKLLRWGSLTYVVLLSSIAHGVWFA